MALAAVTESDLLALLPDCYYMDPPDGGSVTVLEQLQRMALDAARYRYLRANTEDQIPYRGWWQIAGGAGADPARLDSAIDSAMALAVPVPPQAAPDGPINARPNEQSGNQEPHP